jgi:hypothetical protein
MTPIDAASQLKKLEYNGNCGKPDRNRHIYVLPVFRRHDNRSTAPSGSS